VPRGMTGKGLAPARGMGPLQQVRGGWYGTYMGPLCPDDASREARRALGLMNRLIWPVRGLGLACAVYRG